ncbi:MAG: hypothetical protein ABIT36_04445 [Steroidobacteraceae bacterium]
MCESICVRHYSYCTERPYVRWMRRSILFHGKHHPEQMDGMATQRRCCSQPHLRDVPSRKPHSSRATAAIPAAT